MGASAWSQPAEAGRLGDDDLSRSALDHAVDPGTATRAPPGGVTDMNETNELAGMKP